MTRRYLILTYLFLIPVGAYLLADTINLFVGSRLEASVEVPSKPIHKTSAAVPADYRAIVEGNIFTNRLRGKAPVEEKGVNNNNVAVQPVAAPLAPLNLNLVGTVVGSGDHYAVIEDARTHDQTLYRLGDVVYAAVPPAPPGTPTPAPEALGKVVRVARNEVVILRKGQREVLRVSLEEKKPLPVGPTPPAPPPTPAVSDPGIRQVSQGKWVLDRREVDAAVDDLPQLLTKARVVPNFTNGKADGFKIFAIDSGSLYAKIGLQNGDIIQRINGIEMTDPSNFMHVFQQLKDESNISIDLVRDSQKETFGYDIR